MDAVSDPKHPVEQAVEYALYAPLGFALEARRLLPTFVARGRQQVQMAKVIGQFAVTQGEKEAKVRLTKAQEQAEAILAELGLRCGAAVGTASEQSARAAAATPATAAPAPARSSAASAELSIADYDSLAASQVIPRLEGLAADELEAVRRYETDHRGRKTILGKIAQLQDQ